MADEEVTTEEVTMVATATMVIATTMIVITEIATTMIAIMETVITTGTAITMEIATETDTETDTIVRVTGRVTVATIAEMTATDFSSSVDVLLCWITPSDLFAEQFYFFYAYHLRSSGVITGAVFASNTSN